MKLPYSFINKIYNLNINVDECLLYAYEYRAGTKIKALYYDAKLTTKLTHPVKLVETNLQHIHLVDEKHRIRVTHPKNGIIFDDVVDVVEEDSTGGGGSVSSVSATVVNLRILGDVYSSKRYLTLDVNQTMQAGIPSGSIHGFSDNISPIILPFDCSSIKATLACAGCGVEAQSPPVGSKVVIKVTKVNTSSETVIGSLIFTLSSQAGSFRILNSLVSSEANLDSLSLRKGDSIGLFFDPSEASISSSLRVSSVRNLQLILQLNALT